MSFWNRMRAVLGAAKAGASDVAQAANLRLDIRNLEGQRDQALKSMGLRVLRLDSEGRGIPGFETACRDVRDIELKILDTQETLRRMKEGSPDARRAQPSKA